MQDGGSFLAAWRFCLLSQLLRMTRSKVRAMLFMALTTECKVTKSSAKGTVLSPDNNDFIIEAWPFYHLARVVGLYNMRLNAHLKSISMDLPRWRVLSILVNIESTTISEISEITVTQVSTMAKTIQRLAAQELVMTRVAQNDARSTEVCITDRGRKAFETMRMKIGPLSKRAFQDIREQDLQHLNEVTQKIFSNLAL